MCVRRPRQTTTPPTNEVTTQQSDLIDPLRHESLSCFLLSRLHNQSSSSSSYLPLAAAIDTTPSHIHRSPLPPPSPFAPDTAPCTAPFTPCPTRWMTASTFRCAASTSSESNCCVCMHACVCVYTCEQMEKGRYVGDNHVSCTHPHPTNPHIINKHNRNNVPTRRTAA